VTNRGETRERATQFRVVSRRSGVFRDTLHCEALEDTVLKRRVIAIDLLGSNSLAFFSHDMERGEHVAVSVARKSAVQAGDVVSTEWVAKNAKGYRRWTRGQLGHIPNMRFS